MNLELILNNVLPEGCVLYKHCHGIYGFYMDDEEFAKGNEFLTQKVDETFERFIDRLIKALKKDEEGQEVPVVSIDHAINKSSE